MKQRQYITTFILIMALTGLSPVAAADAGRTSGVERIQPDQRQFESPLEYKLSPEQMDKVHMGGVDYYEKTQVAANPTGRKYIHPDIPAVPVATNAPSFGTTASSAPSSSGTAPDDIQIIGNHNPALFQLNHRCTYVPSRGETRKSPPGSCS